jgi:PmbA protein
LAQDFSVLSQKVLKAAKSAGADSADVLLVEGTTVSIEVRAGALEQAERSEGVDVGLRVMIGKRQACVSVSETSDLAIETMAERAVFMAKEAPEDDSVGLADPSQLSTHWDADALDMVDTQEMPLPAQLQEMALEAEAAALNVKGVSQAQGAGAGWSDTQILLAASNGFEGGYRRTGHSVSCVAIAGEGLEMERDYAGESRNHFVDLPNIAEIGTLAGERAIERLGATQPPTGMYPVLFDERVSSTLIGHLVASINGSSIVRGSSWLRDDMGNQILPKGVDLVETPLRPKVSGSRPFDAEGLPVSDRALFEDGVLKSWTLDLATGRKLGLASTGNAARGVGAPPSPRTGNLMITQGSKSREDLLSEMGTGLWVTSMIGSTINPNTGDYSRGAAGFWVENGRIIGPVNECTIAGNLRDMLKTAIFANDAREHLARVIPSILVEGLTIAGS